MVRNAAVFALLAMCAIAAPLAAQHATEAEPNDNASTATLVQLGDTISGTVAYNNLDYFAVDLAAGTKLQLVILDGQFCHGFMLVDRDGQKGLREDDCFHETGLRDTINYQVPTAGRYYFSIWHQDETP